MTMALEGASVKRCSFYLQTKRRNCMMLAARGSLYCCQHMLAAEAPVDETSPSSSSQPSGRRRVACPLDPKHNVYEDALSKHLFKCNASKVVIPACYTANINTGLVDYRATEDEHLSLSSFPPAHVEALTARVEEAYRHYAPVIQEMVLSHASLTKDLEDAINGPSALKHLRQQASILGHLESLGLLCPGTCVAEFGAGRGRLSHCVANALGPSGRVYYVLIDRANCRRKLDVLYRKEHGDRYRRLLIDIEHLDLGKLDLFQGGKVERIVGVSKHLCGCATDLTLRCLLETLPSGRGSRPTTADGRLDAHTLPQGRPTTADGRLDAHTLPQGRPTTADRRLDAHTLPSVSGILIALCCHQRCSWANFVGRDHFARMGFTAADFHMICHMTSWAVCGQRPSKRADGNSSEATRLGKAQKTSCESTVASGKKEHADMLDSDGAGIRNHDSNDQSCTGGEIPHEGVELFGGYVPHPKESIGLKCKRLIDAARLMYLAEHGLNARLVRFVDKSTSLENILLVATPV